MTWISTKEKLPEYGKPVLIKANGATQHVTYMRDGDDLPEDWFEPYHFEHEDELKLPVSKVDFWQYIDNIEIVEQQHYDALIDCCNKLLDRVQQKKVPFQELNGLMILLNREQPLR